MAVAFRSGSTTGDAADVLSRSPAVPAGAAVNDIAVVYLGQWVDGLSPGTITAPSGFTQKGAQWTSNDSKAKNTIWWKRLTAADAGTYTFSWPTSSWTSAQCALFSGCVTSGDPWDAVATPNVGSWGTVSSISLTSTDPNGGLFWAIYSDSGAAGTHTQPTGFTEIADDGSGACAYRIPGSSGSQTATGASIVSTSHAGQWLGALLSEPAGPPPVVDSIRLPIQTIRVP